MRKLFLLIIISVPVILGLMLYLNSVQVRDRALVSADQTLATRARVSADAVDRALQQRMVEVFTFAALPSLRAFAASDLTDRPSRMAVARTELIAIVAADPSVRAAAIMDASGVVVLATDTTVNENWASRLFVRAALRGQLSASVPVSEFGELSQYYSAPLLNNAGDIAGVLVVRVAVQEMWAALSGQSNVMLVDENGVRLADQSDPPQPFVALVPLASDMLARVYADLVYGMETMQIRATNLADLAAAVQSKKNAAIYRDAQGKTIHVAMARLKTNPWTMIAFASEDSILAPARENFQQQLATAGITAFVVACAIFAALLALSIQGKSNDAAE